MDVIREVRDRQIEEGLSDVKFTKKLGVSRQMWEAVVKGKRQPGYKVFSALVATYPDLTDPILDLVDAKVLRGKGGKKMKVIECGTSDPISTKVSRNLWHITEDKEVTLCGYNRLYLFTDPIEMAGNRDNLCPDCFELAHK